MWDSDLSLSTQAALQHRLRDLPYPGKLHAGRKRMKTRLPCEARWWHSPSQIQRTVSGRPKSTTPRSMLGTSAKAAMVLICPLEAAAALVMAAAVEPGEMMTLRMKCTENTWVLRLHGLRRVNMKYENCRYAAWLFGNFACGLAGWIGEFGGVRVGWEWFAQRKCMWWGRKTFLAGTCTEL